MIDPEMVDLTGKVALVTGAARGIGAAAAGALARFGADVAICDRDTEGMQVTAADIASVGRRCFTAELDVRDGDAVASWLTELGRDPGRIDVLVNNAGGGFYAPFLDVSPKGQTSLVDENFTSVTIFVRGCVPLMAEGASIVNVTSIEASRAAPGFGVYAGNEGSGREPHQDAGARARTEGHPSERDRARRHPDAGRRRTRRGRHARRSRELRARCRSVGVTSTTARVRSCSSRRSCRAS